MDSAQTAMATTILTPTRAEALRPDARAEAFVRLRRSGRATSSYPGALPVDLAEAYRLQDDALELWGEAPAGWKVGRIGESWVSQSGTDRLIGPIFASQILRASGQGVAVPVLDHGFAAIEAELILELGEDAPPDQLFGSPDAALALVGAVHVGVEIASSPFSGINDFGPAVTISDFGNNYGLVLGASLPAPETVDDPMFSLAAQTRIGGAVVGVGRATGLPGGPLRSLIAALEIAAARGRPLRRGCLVSTGAITGVHRVQPGDYASVVFEGALGLDVQIVAAPTH